MLFNKAVAIFAAASSVQGNYLSVMAKGKAEGDDIRIGSGYDRRLRGIKSLMGIGEKDAEVRNKFVETNEGVLFKDQVSTSHKSIKRSTHVE
jgi:hypothetical protein